jgi:hypothetical protein
VVVAVEESYSASAKFKICGSDASAALLTQRLLLEEEEAGVQELEILGEVVQL